MNDAEENPYGGTFRERSTTIHVLLIDDDELWARTQQRVLERRNDAITVRTATTLDRARAHLASTRPDCVVCDYQLEDGTGMDLLHEVRERRPDLPFILVTGRGNEAVASEAIGEDVTDYVRKTDLGGGSPTLRRRIEAAVDSFRTERALARERRSKEALVEMMTMSTSRGELAENVCQHLVDRRQFSCAWIGALDGANTVVPLASAGTTEYTDRIVDVRADIAERSEPAFASLAANDPVVVPSLDTATSDNTDPTDAGRDGWTAIAADCGIRSAGAVPIEHDGVHLGVLAVYDTVARRIDEREFAFVTEYADTVGYALQATEWREALLASDVGVVEFVVRDPEIPLVSLSASLPDAATIEVTAVIPRTDAEVLCLMTATDVPARAVLDAAEPIEPIRSVECYGDGDPLRCSVVVERPVPAVILAENGGRFERTILTAASARVSALIRESASARRIAAGLDAVYEHVSTAMLRTDRAERRTDIDGRHESLTDRQRQALELALHAGYFERPRENNTGEVAAMLGVSPATFTQHLRAAERKVLPPVLDDADR